MVTTACEGELISTSGSPELRDTMNVSVGSISSSSMMLRSAHSLVEPGGNVTVSSTRGR